EIDAGPSDKINLRGLIIEGAGVGSRGIAFLSGASLTVQDCVIHGHTLDGISFEPSSASSTSDLVVSNSSIGNNGRNGILAIWLASDISITAVVDRVELYANATAGVTVQDGAGSGTIKATVVDSVATQNGFGFRNSSSGPVTLMLVRSVAANNGTGVHASGSGATTRVSRSVVTGNGIGLQAFGSGVLQSYGDNNV